MNFFQIKSQLTDVKYNKEPTLAHVCPYILITHNITGYMEQKIIVFFHMVGHINIKASCRLPFYEPLFSHKRHVVSLETVVKYRGIRLLLCFTNGVSL